MATSTPRKLPDPGAVALLGTVVVLDVDIDGTVVRHGWDRGSGPGLLWSPSARGFYIFPSIRYLKWKSVESPGTPRGTAAAARLFDRWAERPAASVAEVKVRKVPLQLQGTGVTIDYYSDKWNGRGGKRVGYTHALSGTGSDKVSTSGDGTPTRPPYVIFLKGPRLTVTERGIVY